MTEELKSTLKGREVQKKDKHLHLLWTLEKKPTLGFTDVLNKDFYPGSNKIILQFLSF